MQIIEVEKPADLPALLNLPDRPCALDGKAGFAYYVGDDAGAVISSQANVIVCRRTLGQKLSKAASTEKTVILTGNPLLLFCLIARKKYQKLMQPRDTWKNNPDGSLPSDTSIGPGAVIYDNVTIGNGCIIGANCVIGDTGFGFVRDTDGEFVSMPHFGGVRIGSNVEIGPGSVIDCGTFGQTTIEDNVRIDNLVQIAHNVRIGSGTRVMASVSMSGGVKIGRDCWIAPKSMVRDRITIGDNVLVGCSSMVTVNIPSDHRYQPQYANLHKLSPDPDWNEKV
ncbi:MAG: hypothetical protein DRP45_03405 [Candidatus Zixiibacteriota bacterium]|nr:MAG: hypothetical protein DRP45_03405 [candidate division Zixibacteria bacterium]